MNACITPIQEDLIHQSNISNDDLDHVIAIMKKLHTTLSKGILMNQTSTIKQPILLEVLQSILSLTSLFIYVCTYY